MTNNYDSDTGSRNLYQKLVQETCTRNCMKNCMQVRQSFFTVTTSWPITLQGLCHVPDSFCPGIELSSTACKETCTRKNFYQIDRHTCKFLVQDDLKKFLVQVSWACVAGIRVDIRTIGVNTGGQGESVPPRIRSGGTPMLFVPQILVSWTYVV